MARILRSPQGPQKVEKACVRTISNVFSLFCPLFRLRREPAPTKPQNGLRELQNEPQKPQRPRVPPRRPKMSPRTPKMNSGRSREASGSDLGSFLRKNATPSTRKPRLWRSGGSRNQAKMLQLRRCVRTPRCFKTCNTLAQWPAWGRSPTGDPATEPC